MWYVIQTQTGKEMEIAQKCRDRIARDAEEIFVPLKEKEIKVGGEYRRVEVKLFPSYVFIETTEIEDFYLRLKKIKEMTKILSTDGYLTPLEPEEEALLRKLQNGEHVVEFSSGYLEGEKLVVTEGPLVGLEGEIKKILRHKNLAVLEVSLLGRKTSVTIGLGILERKNAQ